MKYFIKITSLFYDHFIAVSMRIKRAELLKKQRQADHHQSLKERDKVSPLMSVVVSPNPLKIMALNYR